MDDPSGQHVVSFASYPGFDCQCNDPGLIMRAIGGDLQNRNLLYWPRAMATVTWEEASLDYSAIASLLAASAADIRDEVEVTTEATHAFAFNLARPRHAGPPTALTLAPWAASARCGWGMASTRQRNGLLGSIGVALDCALFAYLE
jgi:hypothetical protein